MALFDFIKKSQDNSTPTTGKFSNKPISSLVVSYLGISSSPKYNF